MDASFCLKRRAVFLISVTLLFAFLTLGVSAPAFAQPCRATIRGQVLRDQHYYPGIRSVRNLPIRGINIELRGFTSVSGALRTVEEDVPVDDNGTYRFEGLCRGWYEVRPQRDANHHVRPPNDDIFIATSYSGQLGADSEWQRLFTLIPLRRSIRGRVIHRYGQNPIADVNVAVFPTGDTTRTNESGEFEIRDLNCCKTRYTVAVSKQGYARVQPQSLTLDRDTGADLTFLIVQLVAVPNLRGRTLQRAAAELLAAGLGLRRRFREFNNREPQGPRQREGYIAEQEPEPGAWRAAGTKVTLTVWRNMWERVPEVGRRPWREAAARVRLRKLKPIFSRAVRRGYMYAAGVLCPGREDIGKVVGQRPEPTRWARRDSNVNLTICVNFDREGEPILREFYLPPVGSELPR